MCFHDVLWGFLFLLGLSEWLIDWLIDWLWMFVELCEGPGEGLAICVETWHCSGLTTRWSATGPALVLWPPRTSRKSRWSAAELLTLTRSCCPWWKSQLSGAPCRMPFRAWGVWKRSLDSLPCVFLHVFCLDNLWQSHFETRWNYILILLEV